MISVVIATHDEQYLDAVFQALVKEQDLSSFEVIVVDDCSEYPVKIDNNLYPNFKVVRSLKQQGVGKSFDLGVKKAVGDTIILSGGDIIVSSPKWLQRAYRHSQTYPDSIACAVCTSLDPNHLDPSKPANDIKRYGATLLPIAMREQLRGDNELLLRGSYSVELIESRWIREPGEGDVTEVPLAYGAWYVTTKQWYNKIRGWDNFHRGWGGLEPWVGIKTWLMGGKCFVMNDFEVGHIFNKFGEDGVARVSSKFWSNKFFIAKTMLPPDEADKVIKFVVKEREKYDCYMYPFWQGMSYIRHNADYVEQVRLLNERDFIHDFAWFCDKFNIERSYL